MTISDEHIAQIRGEAMAARHMAQSALKAALLHIPADQRVPALEAIHAGIDKSLAASTFVGGDAALNDIVQEVARKTVSDDLALAKAALTPK